jgi:oligoendopeptidase F
MSIAVGPTPEQLAHASWGEIRAYYDELVATPLSSATLDEWLGRWSALEDALAEADSLALVAYSADTADPAKEAAYLRFSGELGPKVREQRVRLARRLLELGSARADLQVALRRFRNQQEIFRAENVALEQKLERLGSRYQKVCGAMTAVWDGEELPLARLGPFLKDPNRAVRERAFRLSFAPYVAAREVIADILDE